MRRKMGWVGRLAIALALTAVAQDYCLGVGEYGGQCVQYVKAQKPEYAKSLLGGAYWNEAADLWDLVTDKGSEPRVGSILVIDRWNTGNGSAGHAAIVTEVNGSRFKVIQSNWDSPLHVTEGWFTIQNNGTGVKWDPWTSTYPLRGFVYSPGGGPPPPPPGQWRDVGRTTRSPWAAAEFGGYLWGFHLGEYGTKMYVGAMDSNGNWDSNWFEEPGDSDDAVDITSTGSSLVIAHRGLDNNIYWAHLDYNGGTPWMWTGRSTTAPPSVTVWNGRVWLIHKGLDNETMYYASCDPNGNNWSAWQELEGQVRDRPGIAGFQGDLWVIHRGTDNKIYLKDLSRGTPWMWNGRTTQSPPSMVEYGGRLYVIHRGETNDTMYYGSMGVDGAWSDWRELSGATQMQPRLAVFQGRLYAMHVGYDHRMYIMDITP